MKNVVITIEQYEAFLALKEAVKSLQKQNEELLNLSKEQAQQLNWLREQITLSKHEKYCPSSEKTNCEQLSLFNEAEFILDSSPKTDESEPEIEIIKEYSRKKRKQKEDKLPDDLPVIEKEYCLSEDELYCPDCGTMLVDIGTENREHIIIKPAQMFRLIEKRHVYKCVKCEKTSAKMNFKKADWPKTLLPKSEVTPEAAAYVMTQKYSMASPLYRLEKEFESMGILLSRQTMSNWIINCYEQYLDPLIEYFHRKIKEQDILHADETVLQVLHEPNKSPTSKSYIWLFCTGKYSTYQLALYEYHPNRSGENARNFLIDYYGYVHTDGFSGYHNMQDGITVVGCWAHMRRKMNDALKVLPKDSRKGSDAEKGVKYCDKLFHLEDEWAELSVQEIYKNRQEISKPIIEEFYEWLNSLMVTSKSLFGKAVEYALNQKNYLMNYLSDGRLEISNNRAERLIKPFVISRKNFLFANTPRGAKASAGIFSMIETAKINGISPYDYIAWVLTSASGHDLRKEPELIESLTPEKFKNR